MRRAGALVDRTQLKNPNVKLNWQATKKDMVSFLYFDGVQDQGRPQPRHRRASCSTRRRRRSIRTTPTPTIPLHGLWKIADDRVITPNMFLSAKYAYYNTGFILDARGRHGTCRRAAA